ncbi:hypothetical protein [Herbiconiux sp.]|uniref:hypothetical protein n=1 Tax=Herbiconiux sp. TaxID=1871186 RepID=UPI0025B87929|nr:hypothetical protein [Herbiconiux sp.]
MSETSAAVPRAAVTVLLVRRDPLAVLMVERGSVGAFPGALVFPGGVVDAEDSDEGWLEFVDVPGRIGVPDGAGDGGEAGGLDVAERARRVAAARELWEETHLLLGHGSEAAERLDAAGVSAGDGLLAVLRATGLRIDLGLLHPLSRWLTPEVQPKRFDTWFYAAEAPAAAGAVSEAVDGVEILGAQWLEPREVLAGLADGGPHVMLPTRAHLARLDAAGGDWVAWSHAFLADPRTVTPAVRGEGAAARPTLDPADGYPPRD